MKCFEIFRFELAYQLRRPWPWLFFIILLVLDYLMTRDNSLSEALYDEFLVNSPFAIAKTTVFGTLMWLVMAPVIAGTAAARDIETRMHPLLYTSSITKAQYLFGRFAAALLVNFLLLLSVQIAIALAVYSPGVDPKIIGPFRLAAYFTAYGYISIPNAFVATCIQFSIAAKTGKPMASYLASVFLVFMGFFVATILLWKRGLGTLLDPIGIRFIVEDIAHLWTTPEKSTRLLQLDGIILENRLLWLSVGFAFLAYGYFRFKFRHEVVKTSGLLKRFKFTSRQGGIEGATSIDQAPDLDTRPLNTAQQFGLPLAIRQTSAIAWTSFKSLAASFGGLALLVAVPLMSIPVIADQMQAGGGMLVPTTLRVISELTSPLADELSRWVIIPAFIIYFAGELIWRERDARVNEITDVITGSDWAHFIGKFLGIVLILALFGALQMTAGIMAQSLMEYDNFQIGLYVKILFGLQLVEYLLFAVAALTIHVMVNQKYTGHMVAILVYVFIALSSLFGIDHNILVYGAGPLWSYTDMRGFGTSLVPWLWFKLYWASWALLLAILAKLFWVRGKEIELRVRFNLAAKRFKSTHKLLIIISTTFLLATGSFVFYNTNILNAYHTASELKARKAEYEHTYGRLKGAAQPQLVSTSLLVDLFLEQSRVDIKGSYYLKNTTATGIDSVILTMGSSLGVSEIEFNRKADLVITDSNFGQRLYVLKNPLAPGDSVQMNFKLRVESKGFRESGTDQSIVENGTFFTNEFFPAIGYQESRELISPADRREYNLAPRPLIASLYDTTSLTQRSEGIRFEAIVSTTNNQIAGAPGDLKREWSQEGRRYFHYVTDGPIGGEWAFFSANYSVHEELWSPSTSGKELIPGASPVKIRIYHIPEHTAHLPRMIESTRASLAYYTSQFGPYNHSHLTIAERPGEGTGLHADATMLTHSEGFSLWNPSDYEPKVDFPFAVVAHEIAHQWTVPYANVEGAPVMSESIAWYYALKLVENAKGIEHLRGLLTTMRQPHPIAPIRRGEPLLRGLDKYLSYRRGPFALYSMSEYVGEAKVNSALRILLEKHRKQTAPLATTLDLYRELQAVTPDSLKYLLHDLFEVNTFWDLKTTRASAEPLQNGTWNITLDLQAKKVVADSSGVEREAPMADWIEIAVFADAEKGESLYMHKHLISSGKNVLKINVKEKPGRAGIDPYHLLIDLKTDDNIQALKFQ